MLVKAEKEGSRESPTVLRQVEYRISIATDDQRSLYPGSERERDAGKGSDSARLRPAVLTTPSKEDFFLPLDGPLEKRVGVD